jgi:apolipoprotein N-acyltransferase
LSDVAMRTSTAAATAGVCGRFQTWYLQRGRWTRRLLLVLLGALASLAFEPINAIPLFAVGLVALIWITETAPSRKAAFAAGWWWGFGHCLIGYFWISNSFLIDPWQFGWMIPFVISGLCAYMALFPALAMMGAHHRAASPAARMFLLAATWTVTEWLSGHLFTGFPWNLAAYIWAATPEMMQSAALWGSWGLSFCTVLLCGLLSLIGRGTRRTSLRATIAVVGIAAVMVAYGARLAVTTVPPANYKPTALRLVQGNIGQVEKLTGAHREQDAVKHVQLSVGTPGIDQVAAVIWPETAATVFLDRQADWRTLIAPAVPRGGFLITGTLRGDPPQGNPERYWNSLAVMTPAGEIVATADKFHLVPLGEYVPMRDILGPFVRKLTAGAGDFSAGPGPVTVRVPGLPPFSPLICYEIIFPGAVTDPNDRPDWLLNITNDGWFGRSTGPFQHFASARFRAVEEGLPLARAANTGVTALVDPLGRVISELPFGTDGTLDVLLPAPLPPTLFATTGLLIPAGMIGLSLVIGVALMLRRSGREV